MDPKCKTARIAAGSFFALTSMCDVLDWPTGNEAATFLRILS
jgi:hypothetical protein